MERESNRQQLVTVLKVQAAIVGTIVLAVSAFWAAKCGDTLQSCIAQPGDWAASRFLFLSAIRPYLFTPFFFMGLTGGASFGPIGGTIMNSIGAVLSCLALYLPMKFVGRRIVNPWLAANFPATSHLLREQDYKFVLLTRLVPIFPFDLLSLMFGFLNFGKRSVVMATFFGSLPASYMYARIVAPSPDVASDTAMVLMAVAAAIATPMLIYEVAARKSGSSLWTRLRHVYQEILFEVRANNDINRRTEFTGDEVPVILVYGFFSSRRVLAIQERHLTKRGYKVMSFNLGGLFGVFFTSSITETAALIDQKIRRQVERYGFKKFRIIAHSKGGLVALWWLTKMGGHQYCDLLVTMGTPFRGSPLVWPILASPLGWFMRDVWQMRPHSELLTDLAKETLPPNLKMYCCFSNADRVSRGTVGLYRPQQGADRVIAVPMHHVGHTEFLARRDVGDVLAGILEKEELTTKKLQPVAVDAHATTDNESVAS